MGVMGGTKRQLHPTDLSDLTAGDGASGFRPDCLASGRRVRRVDWGFPVRYICMGDKTSPVYKVAQRHAPERQG